MNNLSSPKKKTTNEKYSPIIIAFLLQTPILFSTPNVLNIVHVPAVSHLAVFADHKFQRHVSVVLLCGVWNQ